MKSLMHVTTECALKQMRARRLLRYMYELLSLYEAKSTGHNVSHKLAIFGHRLGARMTLMKRQNLSLSKSAAPLRLSKTVLTNSYDPTGCSTESFDSFSPLLFVIKQSTQRHTTWLSRIFARQTSGHSFTLFSLGSLERSRPFNLQTFFTSQNSPLTMGVEGEKVRTSGEIPRSEPSPVLPTVNPALEKPEPPKGGLPPSFYVM